MSAERTRAKLIGAEWNQYRERVMPADAGPVQVKETRRAFYGGAAILLAIVVGNVSEGEAVADGDLEMMDDLKAELDQFLDDARAGRA